MSTETTEAPTTSTKPAGAAEAPAPGPPASRPTAEDVIQTFFGVEEPTNRRLPDRKGKRP